MAENIKDPNSRRHFIRHNLKLILLSVVFLPVQKILGKGISLFYRNPKQPLKFQGRTFFTDNLVLNTKTNIVHLPTLKIFSSYGTIADKHQKIIDFKNWESVVKPPVHFCKEKSGIIVELLALQKLSGGINDKSLSSATNTLAIAFAPEYRNKNGEHFNIFNFRLHDLLLITIAMNESIPAGRKWENFKTSIKNFDYNSSAYQLPPGKKWIKTKEAFDEQVIYLHDNKTIYLDRLKKRVSDYKL